MLLIDNDRQIEIELQWSFLIDLELYGNNVILINYLHESILKQLGNALSSGYIICIIQNNGNNIYDNLKLYLNDNESINYKMEITPKEIMVINNLYALLTNFQK